ncbi:DUF6710 family protein [Latilactobacillus sakei]|uniref:DUF6710 family protein n=1 Tax=Latilactobacillus sakei TaxID=1599 RepID=UPI0020C7C5E9|nr:DUF6710 family protein [Latilactobacillus sakei]MCP8854613.1 hypothetical protein [Latilactobacillus sakei]
MKLFRKKYKPFPTPENTPGYTNKKVFDNFITEASKILQDTRRSQTVDKTSIFVLLKHLTDLVTLETSFTAYDHSSTEFSDYLLQIFEVRNEHNAKKLFEEIYLNLELKDEDKKYYLGKFTSNTKYTPTLSTLPLVLFPWNYKRISSSIKYIANSNNPFSIEESNGNVINVYFYPLGIALCERGNHSQLSAKLKGVGETSIERIMNIEHVYDHVNYDGIYFYHIFSENEETNPYCSYVNKWHIFF